MIQNKENVLQVVRNVINDVELYEHRGQLSLIIPKERLIDICNELKNNADTAFDMLIDITAIDWLEKKTPRFDVVYFLYSNKYNCRIRLKVPISEKDLQCPSLVKIWESANWYERETFDMYGINFTGHPDLRRFYMPEDFLDPETSEPLYPLRKDFPLMGVPDSLPLPPFPEKYDEVR